MVEYEKAEPVKIAPLGIKPLDIQHPNIEPTAVTSYNTNAIKVEARTRSSTEALRYLVREQAPLTVIKDGRIKQK